MFTGAVQDSSGLSFLLFFVFNFSWTCMHPQSLANRDNEETSSVH